VIENEDPHLTALELRFAQEPDDPNLRLELCEQLLQRGEVAAARKLLLPLGDSQHPLAAQAIARLARLDEQEGLIADALVRWERLLADDIDHDLAWAQIARLSRAGAAPPSFPEGALSLAAPTLESAAGVNVSRFEILREIGRGTSATVYLARDRTLDLEVALKVLHPRTGGAASADLDRHFFHEARAVAALRHPGVVAIHDIDEAARTLVMEYVPGGTLRERLRQPRTGTQAGRRGLPVAEVLGLGRGLLSALAYVHDRGVVHGDLTPRNVLLRMPAQPVLVDFGIARLGTVADSEAAAGSAAGTPLYLAPERFRGAPSSERTDLFAVGALLWEAAVGQPLRTHDDLVGQRAASRPLPADAEAALGGAEHPICRTIAALVAASPENRPASAADALDRLRVV
jgi:tRNA A-37 threonylcarbamoyl transferase component Bud32